MSHDKMNGRQFLALAALYDTALDVRLNVGIIKSLTRQPLGLEDLKDVDATVASHLEWLLDNKVSDLGLTFSHCLEYNKSFHEVELKPNGSSIAVTEQTKHEYVSLLIDAKMGKMTRAQHRAMKDGFSACVPSHVADAVLVADLRQVLAGTREIDVDDWQRHCEYIGFASVDQVPRWFFDMVRKAPDDRRRAILRFCSSLSSPPVGGFATLPNRFRICRSDMPAPRLPVAHTCFAELVLPVYTSAEELENAFEVALATLDFALA
jgi:hypothetical protein